MDAYGSLVSSQGRAIGQKNFARGVGRKNGRISLINAIEAVDSLAADLGLDMGLLNRVSFKLCVEVSFYAWKLTTSGTFAVTIVSQMHANVGGM